MFGVQRDVGFAAKLCYSLGLHPQSGTPCILKGVYEMCQICSRFYLYSYEHFIGHNWIIFNGGYTSILQIFSSPYELLETLSLQLLKFKILIFSSSHIPCSIGQDILKALLSNISRIDHLLLPLLLIPATIISYLDYHSVLGLFAFIPDSLH